MSNYSQRASLYRGINIIFLIFFASIFLFGPINSGRYSISASKLLAEILPEAFKHLDELFDAPTEVLIPLLVYTAIPVVAVVILIKLICNSINVHSLVITELVLSLVIPIIAMKEGAEFSDFGIGIWLTSAIALGWSIYVYAGDPGDEDDDEEDEDDDEDEEIRDTVKTTTSTYNGQASANHRDYMPAEQNDEIAGVAKGMSDTELKNVLAYPIIYNDAFLAAVKAELDSRN